MIFSFKIFQPFSDDLQSGMTKPPWEDCILMNQVHGTNVVTFKEKPAHPPIGDALITQTAKLVLAATVADCQGILIFDPKTKTIAVVHSGWRGSAQNILGKTIAKLKGLGSHPSDLRVAISPSLGPCCAEFTNPVKELPSSCHPFIKERKVDFWELSLTQCREAGVPQNQIEIANECTKCHPKRYYSHRNGDKERMAVFISLK